MFVIDKNSNSIQPLIRRTFSELGFKERAHLQEWIAGDPESLGEKLLIIQKEFCDFSDTNERLDLLALDKNGKIVLNQRIILVAANFRKEVTSTVLWLASVAYYKHSQNYFTEEEWPGIIAFLIEYINRRERLVRSYMPEIKAALKNAVKNIKEPL